MTKSALERLTLSLPNFGSRVAYIESYCCRQTLRGQIMSLIPSCPGKRESFCHYWRRNNTFNTCGKNSCPSLARHSKSQVAGGSFKGGPLKELLLVAGVL